jgi:DNA-binding transcriptional LysR family regulator
MKICVIAFSNDRVSLEMDTRFLETFVAVCDHGSMAEAGRRLNLTAAAVAQRIHALEEEIGISLVSRSGHSVKITEAGRAILDRTRDFIREIGNLKALATGDELNGDLRLGAFSTALTGILPEVLSNIARKYPGFKISIAPGTSADLYAKVHAGTLDAAIIIQPSFALPKSLDWKTIREERLILLTSSSMSVKSPHATLKTQPFVCYGRGTWGGRLIDGYLRKVHIRPRERFELNSLDAIAVLVDRGLGVALVPDWAPPWPEGLSLSKWDLPDRSFDRHVGVIWAVASLRLRFIRAFVSEIVATTSVRKK